MPIREGVDRRHRKIKAIKRVGAMNTFIRIRRRITLRRRNPSLRAMARLRLLSRRRGILTRRR